MRWSIFLHRSDPSLWLQVLREEAQVECCRASYARRSSQERFQRLELLLALAQLLITLALVLEARWVRSRLSLRLPLGKAWSLSFSLIQALEAMQAVGQGRTSCWGVRAARVMFLLSFVLSECDCKLQLCTEYPLTDTSWLFSALGSRPSSVQLWSQKVWSPASQLMNSSLPSLIICFWMCLSCPWEATWR